MVSAERSSTQIYIKSMWGETGESFREAWDEHAFFELKNKGKDILGR